MSEASCRGTASPLVVADAHVPRLVAAEGFCQTPLQSLSACKGLSCGVWAALSKTTFPDSVANAALLPGRSPNCRKRSMLGIDEQQRWVTGETMLRPAPSDTARARKLAARLLFLTGKYCKPLKRASPRCAGRMLRPHSSTRSPAICICCDCSRSTAIPASAGSRRGHGNDWCGCGQRLPRCPTCEPPCGFSKPNCWHCPEISLLHRMRLSRSCSASVDPVTRPAG